MKNCFDLQNYYYLYKKLTSNATIKHTAYNNHYIKIMFKNFSTNSNNHKIYNELIFAESESTKLKYFSIAGLQTL